MHAMSPSPLAVHLADWLNPFDPRESQPKYAGSFPDSAMRIIALANGAKLADIEPASRCRSEQAVARKAELQKRMASARLPI